MKLKRNKGAVVEPERIIFLAPEGGGKSTFAANIPGAVFLDLEGSTGKLDVERLELEDDKLGRDRAPINLTEVRSVLQALQEPGAHPSALVVDTLDWLVDMVTREVCRANNWSTIADGSYGKGTKALSREMRIVIRDFERFQRETGAHLVLLSHAKVRKVMPEGDEKGHDAVTLRADEVAVETLREWATMILFAEIAPTAADPNYRKVTCERTGSVLAAKNRLCLPREMQFTPDLWAQIDKIRLMDPMERAQEMLAGHEMEAKGLEWMAGQPDKRSALKTLKNRIDAVKS